MDPDHVAIAGTIISMARSLNLKVLAEGVESEEQMAFLRTHNCDEIQGFYFSHPLCADEFAAKLKSSVSASLLADTAAIIGTPVAWEVSAAAD